MRTYDEQEKRAYEKAELLLAEKKRRRAVMIRRSAAVTAGAAAVIGVGLATFVLRPPNKPSQYSSGIITDTTVTVAGTLNEPTEQPTSDTAANTEPATSAVTAAQSTSAPALTTKRTDTASTTSAQTTAMTQSGTASAQTTTPARTGSLTSTPHITAHTTTFTKINITTTTSAAVTRPSGDTTTTQKPAPLLPGTTTTAAGTTATYHPSSGEVTYKDMLNREFNAFAPFGSKIYHNRCDLAPENVGSHITDITLVPKNVFVNELPSQVNAQIYEVKGIAPEWAAAVRFADTDSFRVLWNSEVEPATLSDITEGLDLKNTMEVAYAAHGSDKYAISSEKVWELLLADGDIAAGSGSSTAWFEHRVVVDIPLVSVGGVFFGVNENGSLLTNICGNKLQTFYIGKENAQKFIEYMMNCPKTE